MGCGSNPLDPDDFPTIGTGGELICVPEPAALLQLAAGIAALLGLARRRRRGAGHSQAACTQAA